MFALATIVVVGAIAGGVTGIDPAIPMGVMGVLYLGTRFAGALPAGILAANPVITSNYTGSTVDELFSLVVTENEIVDRGLIYVEDGIIYKTNVTKVRQSQIIQDPAATPVSSLGQHTFNDDVIQPDEFLVYIEFNPNEYRKTWERYHPKGKDFLFTSLNPQVQTELLRILLEGENGVNTYMANAILNGDKTTGVAPLNKFNGLITKALADPNVVDVAAPVTLTDANIISKLDAVIQASRIPVRNNKDYKVFMSVPDSEKYRRALEALSFKGIDPTQGAPKTVQGKNIEVLSDLAENTMFATISNPTRSSNIWMGVRGAADFKNIQVEKLQANSDLWFFKMKMAADTYIKWGQDFVLYKP